MSRIFVIGDIHGCSIALVTLLDQLKPERDDTVITLGDYVDRGPDSRGVVDRLVQLQHECRLIPLLGNHEKMMLAAREDESELAFWNLCGGRQTLLSYDTLWTDFPDDHQQFFDGCRLAFETENHLFVHANYLAHLPLNEQPERWMLWEHISTTLPPPHLSGKTAVVGHTPQVSGEVLDLGYLVCLDTFCIGGRWLTAWEPASGMTWQVNNLGLVREDLESS